MKIFIISNTLFGDKKHKEHLDYFYNSFIPYLKENFQKGDFLLHMGGLFENKFINISVMNDVYKLFYEISNIIDVKFLVSSKDSMLKNNNNSYIIFNNIKNIEVILDEKIIENVRLVSNKEFEYNDNYTTFYNSKNTKNKGYNGYYTNFTNKKIGSPYQFTDDDIDKKRGFMIYDNISNKFKFIENNFNKKFINIKIDKEEDIEKIKDKLNNKIILEINRKILKEHENRLNVFISKQDIIRTVYYDDSDYFKEDDNEKELEETLKEKFNEEENSELMIQAFEKILSIYNRN